MNNLFFDIGVIIILSTILATIGRLFKQPTILAYILTGVILGPEVLGLLGNQEAISTMADIGIALLLFIVGLELSFKKLKNLGKSTLSIGVLQVLSTLLLATLMSLGLGFSSIETIYISVALAFSSTIIIVKMLSESKDVNSLYGRISISILIIQDFVAIFVLVFLANLSSTTNLSQVVGLTFIKMAGISVAIWIFTKFLIPPLFKRFSKNQELLFLSSMALCFLFAIITAYANLGIEIGAFTAGLVLAGTPYYNEIAGKIRSIRDFFITLFFVLLGSQIIFRIGFESILPIIVILLFVLLIKPLIIFFLTNFMNFRSSVSFRISTSLAQISEFSLIIIAIGLSMGHISKEVASILTIVGAVTILISTYFIIYNKKLYRLLSPTLKRFEKKNAIVKLNKLPEQWKNEIVLFGSHRAGNNILKTLKKKKERILVVDHDPLIVEKLKKKGYNCIYGDIIDHEILELIDFKNSEVIISTIPEKDDNEFLIKKTKSLNASCIIIVVAEQVSEALELYNIGADYVLIPQLLGGSHVSLILEEASGNLGNLVSRRVDHIEELKKLYLD